MKDRTNSEATLCASLVPALGRLALRMRTLGLGWQAMVALALGGLAATAFPPIHAVPFYALGLSGLAWLLDDASPRRAALVGWLFGVGHFGVGLHWVAYALLTDPERYGWMVPFAVLGLASGLALFTALAALVARWLAPAGGWRLVLTLGASWALAEWLRGHVLTGFPWILAAHVWDIDPAPLQAAAFVGVYGLSYATIWIAIAPALLGCRSRSRLPVTSGLAVAAGLLVALWVGGGLRLAGAEVGEVTGVRLRIVQPNIAQTHKWIGELREAHFQRHLDLSRSSSADGITHVIWPETATPFALAGEPGRRAIMRGVVPENGALITGTLRVEGQGGQFRIWNALQAIDAAGAIVATYDKAHLVPFGEYVPFRRWLPLDKITPGSTDFSAGPGPATLRVPGLPPMSPLICYEVIFPGDVLDPSDRPAWLLNVTNDAWFGMSPGPYQHLAAARLRAVEEGLPLVRAANTGISAVIDPYGRFTGRLALGTSGALDRALPQALTSRPIFTRLGDVPFAFAVGAVLWFVALRRRTEGDDIERR